jgi:hypothetical protein
MPPFYKIRGFKSESIWILNGRDINGILSLILKNRDFRKYVQITAESEVLVHSTINKVLYLSSVYEPNTCGVRRLKWWFFIVYPVYISKM